MHGQRCGPPPLEGVRVVDLTRLLPGPYCTWQLAALGAEVIRVETPGSDYTRDLPPRAGPHSAFFAAINRGKRSVCLDWRSEHGREALLALLGTADVVVEGFKPGVMERIGLGADTLRQCFPRLILASISGYGHTGPMRTTPGHDLNYLGYAGVVAAAGGLAPSPVQIADLAGGALPAALAICAALVGRQRSGQGAWLDLSMTEGAMALMAPHLAVALAEGRDLRPGQELLSGGYAGYRSYACADGGLVTVAPLEAKFLDALEAALGPVRPEHEALTALFLTRPRDEWVQLLGEACVGPALRAHELPVHPQHQARGVFQDVYGVPMPRAPFPWAASVEVPVLGQDTEAVLGALGLAPELLAQVLAEHHAAVAPPGGVGPRSG